MKSTCEALKPRRALRPRLPWPLAGTVKAALIDDLSTGCGRVGRGRAARRERHSAAARCWRLTRNCQKGFFPVTTFTGGALRAYTIEFTDQFSRIGFHHSAVRPRNVIGDSAGEGIADVVVGRTTIRYAADAPGGTFRKLASEEASSMECAHV